ncbi:MAG TPA: hypothetical protein VNS83_00960, partial [Lapillicoccus sp.]|nr:hypothetical protein [Lapillicoccus sp.]
MLDDVVGDRGPPPCVRLAEGDDVAVDVGGAGAVVVEVAGGWVVVVVDGALVGVVVGVLVVVTALSPTPARLGNGWTSMPWVAAFMKSSH